MWYKSHLNKAVSEKQKNYIEDLNNSINHLDLIDICETPHNICTTFSSYVMRVGRICFLLGATIGLGNIYMTKTQSMVPQSWEFIAAVPQGRIWNIYEDIFGCCNDYKVLLEFSGQELKMLDILQITWYLTHEEISHTPCDFPISYQIFMRWKPFLTLSEPEINQ